LLTNKDISLIVRGRLYCITFAESEPYCHSRMFVCLDVCWSRTRQTLLVLQFVIEFANIWAQYSPSTYASTHVGFFDLCPNVQMAALSGCLLVTPLLLHGRTVGCTSGRCGCCYAARSRSHKARPSEELFKRGFVYARFRLVSPSITRILATANVTHRAI